MSFLNKQQALDQPDDTAEAWPAQVEMILSAIDAGAHPAAIERRTARRHSYRVRGWLHLFSDGHDAEPRVLYTRDVHARGLGFITPHRLPLGYGGRVHLPLPDGAGTLKIHCTLLRCREAAPGWYEGSLYFNREQPHLVPEPATTEAAQGGAGGVLALTQ